MHQIFLATHNLSKIKRLQDFLQLDNLQLLSPQDINFQLDLPQENGEDEVENAKIKAKEYYRQVKIPCLALDTGLYFEDLPKDQQPAKHVQRIAGVLDTDTQEIRFEKMSNFYANLAKTHGGQLSGYFLDVYCLFDGQNFFCQQAKRKITLTDKIKEKDLDFPICSLYKVQGVYYHDLDKEQMQEFLKPSLTAVKSLLEDFLKFKNTNLKTKKAFQGPISAIRIGLKPFTYGQFFLEKISKQVLEVHNFTDLEPLLKEISEVLDQENEQDKEYLKLIFQQVGRKNPQWAIQFKQIFKNTLKLSKPEIEEKYNFEPEFIINPSYEAQKDSHLDLVIAGNQENIVMVEASAKIVTEKTINKAIDLAVQELQILTKFQQEFLDKCYIYDQENQN